MDQGQAALDLRVAQVEEVLGKLRRGEHPLVDDGPAGEAADVEGLLEGRPQGAHGVGQVAAADVEAALEVELVGQLRRPGDEELADHRLQVAGALAETAVVGGDRAPAEKFQAVLGDDLLGQPLAAVAVMVVPRQVEHRHRVVPGRRQAGQILAALAAEEVVGDLQQDAGAVATIRIAADRTAVLEVAQHLEGLLHQLMAAHPLEVDDEADPAGIMLVGGVVESLAERARRSGHGGTSRCRGCERR